MTVLVWNIDNVNAKWDLLLLLIDRYKPDLIFLNEAKLRKSEIFDLNNKSNDYKFYSLLPEDVAKDHEEIMKITRKAVQKGLLIGTRRDDPTTIKVLPKQIIPI